ncbi:ribbon-helix-helix protein, CopG family [Paraburkholderia sp. C35]|uniref:ribbon-helix-helix protein, CopG family n=1 Tax=Paraburkholderia sp. C35 TaxID=2126993 RepID=UPI000D685581|nr:ribbon-helix-helix protein, CopG family [Paraburkholderia sp. C35]
MATTHVRHNRETEQVNIRLEPFVLAKLDEMAAARSTTRSDVFRTLLAAWMRDPSSVTVGFPVNNGSEQ